MKEPKSTNADLVTTNAGNLLLAKASDAFLHDSDGNLKGSVRAVKEITSSSLANK